MGEFQLEADLVCSDDVFWVARAFLVPPCVLSGLEFLAGSRRSSLGNHPGLDRDLCV